MRLEDWQKWLDTQYLPPEHDMEAGAVATAVGEESAPVAVVEVRDGAAESTPPVEAASGRESTRIEAPRTSAERDSSGSEQFPVVSSTAAARAASAASPVEDVAIPDFADYMPFLRARSPQPEAAAVEVSAPGDMESVEAAEEKSGKAGEGETGLLTEAEIGLDAKDEIRGNNGSDEPASAAADEPAQPATDVRSINTLARRGHPARLSRVGAGPQPLDTGTLWALSPRHIQGLLSLGSDDVAQNSYKRSFRESRIELISRLVDPTLSLEETARLLSVCPTTVRRYTNRGLLIHQRTPGDQRRFRLSDVLAFVEAQSRGQ